MELKDVTTYWARHSWASFNRTFMELKVRHGCDGLQGTKGFNRTFMELKVVADLNPDTAILFQSHLYGIESC